MIEAGEGNFLSLPCDGAAELRLYSDFARERVVTGEVVPPIERMSRQEASMLLVLRSCELMLILSSSRFGLLGLEYASSSCHTEICCENIVLEQN